MPFCRWLSKLPETDDDFWTSVRLYFAKWCQKYALHNAWVSWRSHKDAGPLRYDLEDVELPDSYSGPRNFCDRVTCTEVFALFSFPDVLQESRFVFLVSLRDICDSCAALLIAYYRSYGWLGLEVISYHFQDLSPISMSHRTPGEKVFEVETPLDFRTYDGNEEGLVGDDEKCFWFHFSLTIEE